MDELEGAHEGARGGDDRFVQWLTYRTGIASGFEDPRALHTARDVARLAVDDGGRPSQWSKHKYTRRISSERKKLKMESVRPAAAISSNHLQP